MFQIIVFIWQVSNKYVHKYVHYKIYYDHLFVNRFVYFILFICIKFVNNVEITCNKCFLNRTRMFVHWI